MAQQTDKVAILEKLIKDWRAGKFGNDLKQFLAELASQLGLNEAQALAEFEGIKEFLPGVDSLVAELQRPAAETQAPSRVESPSRAPAAEVRQISSRVEHTFEIESNENTIATLTRQHEKWIPAFAGTTYGGASCFHIE